MQRWKSLCWSIRNLYIIHLFLYDVEWYRPNEVEPYSLYKSIVLHFKIVDISLEYMEGNNEQ